jgi:hypothetical protein
MMLDPSGKRDEATHHAVEKIGQKLAQLFEAGGVGIDYFNAKRLMLITSRTPDPVMVKA